MKKELLVEKWGAFDLKKKKEKDERQEKRDQRKKDKQGGNKDEADEDVTSEELENDLNIKLYLLLEHVRI